jgi:hypothetical protein
MTEKKRRGAPEKRRDQKFRTIWDYLPAVMRRRRSYGTSALRLARLRLKRALAKYAPGCSIEIATTPDLRIEMTRPGRRPDRSSLRWVGMLWEMRVYASDDLPFAETADFIKDAGTDLWCGKQHAIILKKYGPDERARNTKTAEILQLIEDAEKARAPKDPST